MADKKVLKPQDFPIHAEEREIVTETGKAIAEACNKKTAEDVADRLNSDEARQEEDRWGA
jgi:hypothetical protein